MVGGAGVWPVVAAAAPVWRAWHSDWPAAGGGEVIVVVVR